MFPFSGPPPDQSSLRPNHPVSLNCSTFIFSCALIMIPNYLANLFHLFVYGLYLSSTAKAISFLRAGTSAGFSDLCSEQHPANIRAC
jgi:hypothetical protein